MSIDPSIQNSVKLEPADLLARAENQLHSSRKIVDAFRQQRQEEERLILDLIESNKQLAAAIMAFTEKGVTPTFSNTLNQEAPEMELARTLVPPHHLKHDKEYFSRAHGKVLLQFCRVYQLCPDGVTASEIAAATNYNEATVKTGISQLRTYTLGPVYENATEAGKGYQIEKVGKDKWALVKLRSSVF